MSHFCGVYRRLQRSLPYFSLFLLLMGFAGGGLWMLYREMHLASQARPTFSTEQIANTNRLNRRLTRIEAKNADLAAEIVLLNRQIHQRYQAQGQEEYAKLQDFLGLQPKAGNGLEIILEDSAQPVRPGDNPNIGIIHNTDLLLLLNQLRTAGAKAVAINRQRIAATSAISCAGPIIMINKSRVSAPFVIEVLGHPKRILRRLNRKDSYLKYLASYGIRTAVHPKFIQLPAYALEGN